jgi:hypothetical protein
MSTIDKYNVFSHVRRDEWVSSGFGKPQSQWKEFERKGFFSISEIRKSKGTKVNSFASLACLIAEIGYHNHRYNLLFRGQANDDKDKNDRTRIYPSIYRPEGQRLSRQVSKERFQNLKKAITALSKARKSLGIHSILNNHSEYYIALLQHYQLLRTPMLDLTSSLLVAASFALEKGRTGYLFVFGMPHPQGSISHFIDDSLVLVKLQNVCPPEALRPHFQEAYLVGKLPINSMKEAKDNFGTKLIGKYFLDNSSGNFWKDGFKQIPKKVLYPSNDTYLKRLKSILREQLNNVP